MVSQRLWRMAAPHLFRVCTVNQAYVDGRRHLIQAQSALLRYTAGLHLNDDVDTGILVTELTGAMPSLKVLDIIVANRRVRRESLYSSDMRSYVELRRDDIHLKLPQISSLRVVYLRGFWAGLVEFNYQTRLQKMPQLRHSTYSSWDLIMAYGTIAKTLLDCRHAFPI
jgi:hypothetical protein